MPTREELHALVDSLPDEALKTASNVLRGFQTWPPPAPPKMPPDLEAFREEIKQHQKERIATRFNCSMLHPLGRKPSSVIIVSLRCAARITRNEIILMVMARALVQRIDLNG